MNFRKINKFKITFSVIFVLLLVFIGVFLWRSYRTPDVGLVRFEEFEIEETEEGKIIRHREFGLELTIPKDWEIVDGRDGVYFNSSDFEIDPVAGPYSPPIPREGCIVMAGIKKEAEGTDYDILYTLTREKIKLCLEPSSNYNCEYEIIKIDKNEALKHISNIKANSVSGDQIRIQVPKNKRLYVFETYLFGQDKERCAKEFDNILETVKINE